MLSVAKVFAPSNPPCMILVLPARRSSGENPVKGMILLVDLLEYQSEHRSHVQYNVIK